jgi:hypothetical protein
MIFLPFNTVLPSSLPTAYPMYAPVTIVTGHFCHSRSLRGVSSFSSLVKPGNPRLQRGPNIKEYSPVQRYWYRSKPSSKHGANQSTIDFIHRHQQSNNLPPCIAVHTVDVDKRKRAQQRDVSAAEKRVQVVCGDGCSEEDKRRGEEGRRSEGGQQQREEGGLYPC